MEGQMQTRKGERTGGREPTDNIVSSRQSCNHGQSKFDRKGMRARERYPRGQSSPHRAMQRLPAGRARDHPVMEIVPNKSFSLSLSPHTCGHTHKDVCMLDESRNHWAKTGLFLYKRPIFKTTGSAQEEGARLRGLTTKAVNEDPERDRATPQEEKEGGKFEGLTETY